MAALREIFAEFRVNFDDKQLRRGDQAVSKLSQGVKKLGLLIGGTAVIYGIKNFVKHTVEQADVLAKTSKQLGVTVEALQELRYAAQISGVEISILDKSVFDLQKNTGMALDGLETYTRAFKHLGINVEDFAKLSPEDQFLTAGAAIGDLTSQTQKAAIAQQLFGRGGRKLLPLFNEGSAGISKLRKEFAELGGGLSEDMAKRSEEAADQLTRINLIIDTTKSRIVGKMLPTLLKWGAALQKAILYLVKLSKETYIFETALGALGVALAVFAAKSLAPFAPIILAIGLAILGVEDLIAAFRGGQSVIGDFLNEFFGVDLVSDFFGPLIKNAWIFQAILYDTARIPEQISLSMQRALSGVVGFLAKAYNGVAPIVNLISKIPGMGGVAKAFQTTNAQFQSDASAYQNQTAGKIIGFNNARSAALSGFSTEAQKNAEYYLNQAGATRARNLAIDKTGAGGVSQTNNVNVNVTTGSGDPKKIGEEVAKRIRQENAKMLSNAKAGLVGG